MRTPTPVLVLPGLLAIVAAAAIWPRPGAIAPDSRAKPPLHTLASYGPEVRPLLPAPRTEDLTTASGRRLSCDEIRSMDEMEWITDDSYCTESS